MAKLFTNSIFMETVMHLLKYHWKKMSISLLKKHTACRMIITLLLVIYYVFPLTICVWKAKQNGLIGCFHLTGKLRSVRLEPWNIMKNIFIVNSFRETNL